MRYSASTFGDFKCAHCGILVSSAHLLSGVNNRNHCPYCLWSRHLDLYAAGDRLAACKAPMQPIALTMKLGRNKYRRETGGELMLVHRCMDCASLSINRIAADDDPSALLAVFQSSLSGEVQALCERQGIFILQSHQQEILSRQLYGSRRGVPETAW